VEFKTKELSGSTRRIGSEFAFVSIGEIGFITDNKGLADLIMALNRVLEEDAAFPFVEETCLSQTNLPQDTSSKKTR
jgi:hypothetical protein